jgi:hypothetical protein
MADPVQVDVPELAIVALITDALDGVADTVARTLGEHVRRGGDPVELVDGWYEGRVAIAILNGRAGYVPVIKLDS